MNNNLKWIFKSLHLIISLSIVVPTAIIYGSPSVLPEHLDIEVNTVDLSNMLKAIMCLYLGISLIWALGIWKSKYWKIATQLNVLFMLTLATGRALSMIMDGFPTGGYIFGIFAELLIGLFSLYQLKKYAME
ncbi:DUF4345 domain-containing protein [Maribacter sp. MJ134]|uniref:DUF4345 domain-containing protein n=1 Tax=Maribacter sp. MJ134 TaxID=2496865 RepID=UPI000F82AA8C|nr:DUF4345 domain-containing protein [Maribacter sp. MJ134]AZQ57966.1 DUF4345 domain-containing protein [Maribacter sp. MJ134]